MANPKLKPNQFLLPCGAMITERPILFSTDMVHANLVDRKTQTRREIKELPPESIFYKSNLFPFSWIEPQYFGKSDEETNVSFYRESKFGKPGDLLWVRETWSKHKDWTNEEVYQFKALHVDDPVQWDETDLDPWGGEVNIRKSPKWKPSIHMPKNASRIWVMVEEIRVERLQEISEEDAKAEGVESEFIPMFDEVRFRCYSSKNKIPYQGFPKHWASNWREAKSSFESLWTSINGEDSWNSNPWVWVVKYRILSKTGRPSIETIEKNYLEVTKPKP